MLSYCEGVTASSISPWCIRRIPDGEAKKLSGGITTPSICGRVKARWGWDLEVDVDFRIDRTCRKCLDKLEQSDADKLRRTEEGEPIALSVFGEPQDPIRTPCYIDGRGSGGDADRVCVDSTLTWRTDDGHEVNVDFNKDGNVLGIEIL